MPKTYGTEGQDDAAVVLHYFTGGSDWWVVEKDNSIDEDGKPDGKQVQAFGLVSLNGWEPELGYINLEEVLEAGAELDLHWTPQPLSKVMERANQR